MTRTWYLTSLILAVFLTAFLATYIFLSIFKATPLPVSDPLVYLGISQTPVISKTAPVNNSILFLGDILLSRKVERYMHTQGLLYPFLEVSHLFEDKAAVVANFEASVPIIHKPTPDLNTQFSVLATFLPVLREVGITHTSLANNHSNDFGRAGYTNTWSELRRADVIPFGDPQKIASTSITIIKMGHYRVGLIAIHAVFEQPDKTELNLQLKELSKLSDVQIAYVHWGTEYRLTHSKAQSSLAELLIAGGIDTVIGHHPHVTEDIEIINGVPVFYSLGNFIFDQYFSAAVQEGYALEFTMEPDSLIFNILPVSSLAKQSQPSLMEATDKSVFLTKLAARSDSNLSQSIKLGKLIVPFSLATSTKTRIISP